MKLSNKILIGVFGFIFLYLTAAFAELRMTGIPNIIDESNSIAETVDIAGVTHFKINDIDKDINIIGSDKAQLEVLSFSGDVLKKLTYKISGDTLTLSGLQSEGIKTMKISVFIPKSGLKGITVNNSTVNILHLHSDLLDIVQNAGNIWMSDSEIGNMNLSLANCVLEISGSTVDSLSAKSENSRVNIYSSVRVVQGSIADETIMYITDLEEIQMKKDKTSVLRVNQ